MCDGRRRPRPAPAGGQQQSTYPPSLPSQQSVSWALLLYHMTVEEELECEPCCGSCLVTSIQPESWREARLITHSEEGAVDPAVEASTYPTIAAFMHNYALRYA